MTQIDQYERLCKRILNEGVMVENKRTGSKCLTVINANLTYDVGSGLIPAVTTRRAAWKMAIAELLGYLRKYTDAQQFADLGAGTWFANANENAAWLANPYRKGENDMGKVYGANIVRTAPDGVQVDQLADIVSNLQARNDNRALCLTYWDPAVFHMGCLKPCLHSFQFSLLGDELYLDAQQRSCDVPLGGVANQIQVFVLLAIMARITGLKPALAQHRIVNAHIYQGQIELMREQVKRTPFAPPSFSMNPEIKTLDDVLTWVTPKDFALHGYEHHEDIKYPFSV